MKLFMELYVKTKAMASDIFKFNQPLLMNVVVIDF